MPHPLERPLPEFELIPDELLALATPEEVNGYNQQAKIYTALLSPLRFAQHVSSNTEEYKHILLLDKLITALLEHRLYFDGPGEQGIQDKDPNSETCGLWFHPTRRYTEEEARQAKDKGDPYATVGGKVPVLEKLFVTMPPRHGKSYLISEHTPPWFLVRYPDARIILCSYEADFAASWGRKSRDHIKSHPEFNVLINPNAEAASRFEIHQHDGGMNTAGAGGAITGKGAHLLITDDPIKNAEEALSETHRENTYNWYISTARSRLEPEGLEILIHTRWHEDDLGGRLMRTEGYKWYHIDLPALAAPTEDVPDPLGRQPGEALCPERYSRARLLEIERTGDQQDGKTTGGKRWFSALYQQKPTTEGSGIFKRGDFRYWIPQLGRANQYEPDEFQNTTVYTLQDNATEQYINKSDCIHFITVDLAATVKSYSDWTVFALYAVTPFGQLLLVDRLRERMDSADHLDNLRKYYASQRLHTNVSFIGVEAATYGLTLMKQALREGLPIRALTADKDKIARAIPAGAATENHIVYLPARAPWLQEFEDECIQFPNGSHDDQVDTLAYAVYQLNSGQLSGFFYKVREDKDDNSLSSKIDKFFSKREKGRRIYHHPELGKISR